MGKNKELWSEALEDFNEILQFEMDAILSENPAISRMNARILAYETAVPCFVAHWMQRSKGETDATRNTKKRVSKKGNDQQLKLT